MSKITYPKALDIKLNLYGNAVGTTVISSQDDSVISEQYPLRLYGPDIDLGQRFRISYLKSLTFDIQYSKELDLNGVIIGPTNTVVDNTGRFEITEITGPDANFKYARIKFNDVVVNGENTYPLRFKYDIVDKTSGKDSYTMQMVPNGPYTHTTVDGVTFDNTKHDVGVGRQTFVIRDFDNKLTMVNTNDGLSKYEVKNEEIPLGRLGFINPYNQAVEDMMFKVVFPDDIADFTGIRLNTGNVRAYDIKGVTTKGREFTSSDKTGVYGRNREVNRDNLSISLDHDEFIKEIQWTEQSIPANYESSITNWVSNQLTMDVYTTYYGQLREEKENLTADQSARVEYYSIPKSIGDFNSPETRNSASTFRIYNRSKD